MIEKWTAKLDSNEDAPKNVCLHCDEDDSFEDMGLHACTSEAIWIECSIILVAMEHNFDSLNSSAWAVKLT